MVHKGFTCALSKLQRPGDLIVSPEMLHEFELLVPSCSVSLITILTIYKERSEILLSHFLYTLILNQTLLNVHVTFSVILFSNSITKLTARFIIY